MFMDIRHFHSAWLLDVAIAHSGRLSKCSSLNHGVAVLQGLAIFFPPMNLIIFNYRQKLYVQYCVGSGVTILVSG
jgi:hypothetical protein